MNTIDATPQISRGDRVTLGCRRYLFVKELLRTNTQNIRARPVCGNCSTGRARRLAWRRNEDSTNQISTLREGNHTASGRSIRRFCSIGLASRDDVMPVMRALIENQ